MMTWLDTLLDEGAIAAYLITYCIVILDVMEGFTGLDYLSCQATLGGRRATAAWGAGEGGLGGEARVVGRDA